MQSLIQSGLRFIGIETKPQPLIFLDGTAVGDASTLLHLVKTNQYSPRQSSAAGAIEDGFKLGPATVKIIINGSNESARRSHQADTYQAGHRLNGLIYLLDLSYDEAGHSKKELHMILSKDGVSDLPIVILALSPTGNETVSEVAKYLELEDKITSEKDSVEVRPLGLFVVCLPLDKGYQEAFDWFSRYL
ncbi:hypothetical protein C8J56DRAFT_142806 [Mycena floridula]|nr:hypothetical protein C8J56DRAFT_142806 [Mycena floridula]